MTPAKIKKHLLRYITFRRNARYNKEQHSKCLGYVLNLLKEISYLRKELKLTNRQIDESDERINKPYKT